MDMKIGIKEEDAVSDAAASQNEKEMFHEVVAMKRNSDAVFVYNDCKTEIESETAVTKHFAEQFKFETVTCSNNWEIDRKTESEQQTLVSNFGSHEGEFLPEDPVMKNKNYNEMDNKLEIKVQPWWLQTETSSVCDDVKDADFSAVKSTRLCTEAVPGTSSGKSPVSPAEVFVGGTSFYNGKYHLECERQRGDVIEIPTAEEHFLIGQSGNYSVEGKMNVRPVHLKERSSIYEGKKSHRCKTCNKSFGYLSYLKTHNLIHEGKKPHQCKSCHKSFSQLSNLKTHNMIHEGKKPHQCKICDKSFTQLSQLKTHNFIHDGKRPHQCEICDKSFIHLSSLKAHSLTHEDKKLHQCKTCGKRFTLLSVLKRHNLIHEGKKPHQCKTCDKSFVHLANLKAHNLIHEGKKPHQCKTCNKSFTYSSNLKAHNSIHEGRKPYQCITCQKSFTQLSYLKRHNLIHEGKKLHQCNTCDKSFTQSAHLKRHILIHEGKK